VSLLFGLLSAAGFGSGDFLAGLVSRRLPPSLAALVVQAVSALVAVVAVLLYPGEGVSSQALLWGVAAGVGTTCGALALYKGLSVGRMSVVATLAGLLAAVIPVVVGLATGDSLGAVGFLGVVVAIPAIGLVSWQPGDRPGGGGTGAVWGILSGLGASMQFIGLDRAGSAAGAWPLLISAVTATLLTIGPAVRGSRHGSGSGRGTWDRDSVLMLLGAGGLIGIANLCFVIANHVGELAVAALLAGLYPGFTVILARLFLDEHWSPSQKLGLATALLAALLVGLGTG
jgi:drug/metabolite transporter (DMT)-like permease